MKKQKEQTATNKRNLVPPLILTIQKEGIAIKQQIKFQNFSSEQWRLQGKE